MPSQPGVNLKKMEAYISEASHKGAQLIVFPEDSVTGPLSGQLNFVQEAPNYLSEFKRMAVENNIDIVPGTWTSALNTGLYNSAHYIGNKGELLGVYSKINLWENEKMSLTPGSQISVFQTRFGLIGLTICWDLAFPEIFSEMAKMNPGLIISPSYWSFTAPAHTKTEVAIEETELIDSLCLTRAFESNLVLAYCNAAGALRSEGVNSLLSGRSQVVHPNDKVVCRSDSNKEELLICTVLLPK